MSRLTLNNNPSSFCLNSKKKTPCLEHCWRLTKTIRHPRRKQILQTRFKVSRRNRLRWPTKQIWDWESRLKASASLNLTKWKENCHLKLNKSYRLGLRLRLRILRASMNTRLPNRKKKRHCSRKLYLNKVFRDWMWSSLSNHTQAVLKMEAKKVTRLKVVMVWNTSQIIPLRDLHPLNNFRWVVVSIQQRMIPNQKLCSKNLMTLPKYSTVTWPKKNKTLLANWQPKPTLTIANILKPN